MIGAVRAFYMDWNQVVEKVTPHIVKIETPMGHGTGFFFVCNESKSLYGVATALHVVDYADEWQQPIRVYQPSSGKSLFLTYDQRVIFPEWTKDSAVILIPNRDLIFPKEFIPLLPASTLLGLGVEVGWLGFPAIEPSTLCFFSGNISARQDFRNAYLIDGVAINGVSGGPVLYSTNVKGVQIVGSISAYKASRTTGGALPGLSLAQDVSHFHDVVNQIRSIDEANRKKQQLAIEKPKPDTSSGEPTP